MLITKTAPVSYTPDSFTVEIELLLRGGDSYTPLVMGPFKRLEHWDNLEDLLLTLERVDSEDRDFYKYTLGFLPWFRTRDDSEIKDFEEECLYELDDDEKEDEQKKSIILSTGFAQDWHYEPQTDGEFLQEYSRHKVFYHDNSGLKFETTVQLDAS